MMEADVPIPPAIPSHWPTDWTVDPHWFEDDAFWEAVRPALFEPRRWDDAEAEVVQALALLGVAPPDRILDLACGPGRHLIPLAEFGYRATGVDRTAKFLNEARERARARDLHIQTTRADMRSLGSEDVKTAVLAGTDDDGSPFDGAIWLDSSIGYSPRATDDLDALRAVRDLLRPGARLVVETLGLECVQTGIVVPDGAPEEVEIQAVDGRPWLLQRRITDDHWMEVRWGPTDGHPLAYRHRLYREPDLYDMLREVDMCNILTFGELDGSPYGPAASTLIAVAER